MTEIVPFDHDIHPYHVAPKLRRPADQPIHPRLYAAIAENREKYAQILSSFLKHTTLLEKVPVKTHDGRPHWDNYWFPPLDAISLYSFLAEYNPKNIS